MGIGFALIFQVTLFGILFGVTKLFCYLVGRSKFLQKPPIQTFLKWFPWVFSAMPITVFVLALIWVNITPPSEQFRAVFGIDADEFVENLQGDSSGSNDFRQVYLAFTIEPPQLSKLLKTARFFLVREEKERDKVPLPIADDLPDWWTAHICGERDVYVAKNLSEWDDVVVIQCHDDGATYVEARWID